MPEDRFRKLLLSPPLPEGELVLRQFGCEGVVTSGPSSLASYRSVRARGEGSGAGLGSRGSLSRLHLTELIKPNRGN